MNKENKTIEQICYKQAQIIKTQIYNLLETVCENYTSDNVLNNYIINQLDVALQIFDVLTMNLSYVLQNKGYELIAVLNEKVKGVRV